MIQRTLSLLPPQIRKVVYQYLVSPITGTWFRFFGSLNFFVGVWQSYKPPTVGLVPVANASGGLLKPLILPWLGNRNLSALLVSEPSTATGEILEYLTHEDLFGGTNLNLTTLEDELRVVWSPQQHNYDLAVQNSLPNHLHKNFDLIICQALLEHVINPVAVIENLLQLRSDHRSILAIQTVNPYMGMHRYPIDTLRFFPDFFLEHGAKNGLSVAVFEDGCSIYAFFAGEFDSGEHEKLKEFFG